MVYTRSFKFKEGYSTEATREMLFLLWLFSFSKACSINEEFAYGGFMIFKNITGKGIVSKYLPIPFWLLY